LGFSSIDLAATTMFAPSFASLSAMALPIPLLAPVIKAVLPWYDIKIIRLMDEQISGLNLRQINQ
jgi:hypothetical protein